MKFIFRADTFSSVFAFLFLLFPNITWAQDYIPQTQCIGMDEGLSDYNIYKFFQDSRGVMWIATQYGLNRYDGSSIKVYNKEDLGLDSDWVLDIEEDANHMLWVRNMDPSNRTYIHIFDPITEEEKGITEYTGTPCPFNPTYTKISPLYNGINMLIEIKDSTINYYELEGDQLSISFTIRLDSLYLGHYADLHSDAFKLSQDTFLVQFSKNEMAYVNNKGEILRMVDLEENLHKKNELDLKGNIVDTKRDEKIISKNNIRYSFEKDSVKIYSTSGQLLQKKEVVVNRSKSKFQTISIVDHHGNLWYYSTQRSFCILSLKEQKFKVEAFSESSAHRTRGILKTSQGTIYAQIWNSQDQILLYQKSSESSSFNKFFGGSGLLEADTNSLWISGSALYHYNLPTKKRVIYPSKEQNHMWQPYKSPDGDIWVGINTGMVRLDTLTEQLNYFNDYSNFPILQNSTVYAFHTNEKGTWLATSAGLFLVDLDQEKILEYYSDSQVGAFHIPTHHIAHLHEDEAGIFWLATKGDGLIRWDPKTKTSKVFSKANTGLSHDVLYGVYEDDYDHLWISSNWGLMSFNKTSHLVTTYLEEDGIPNNEFNTISHHKDKEGNMYFGTQNGFIHFHPKDFIPEKTDYPFIISACTKELLKNDSITKLTAQVLESHEINFYPSDKSINLDFALLDYQNSKSIQYSYKVEGYHQDWIYQKESNLQLIGLPYGDYQLLLRAKSVGSHFWQEYPEAIKIKVKKPFYLEWWFIAGSILALSLLVVYIVRIRTQKLISQKEELEQIVAKRTEKIEEQNEELRSMDKVKSNFFANISHELRTPLTLILGPLSYVLDNPEEWNKERVQKQLRVMQRNGKSLLQLIEEILDLSKLEANKMKLEEEATSIRDFFEHVFWVFEPQFQSLGIDYDLIFNLEGADLHVLLDRKKMEKVLNNYLSNAIKFTPKGNKVSLTISETENLINIKVSDTGKGVHANDLPYIFERFYQSKQAEQKLYGGTGIGLALVNEFANLMGGKAYAESTLGLGSQFYYELPKKIVAVHAQVPKSALAISDIEMEEELIASIGTDFTILVVEDNEDMRNFVCQLLETKYKRVIQAKNGAEGLDQLTKHGLDIRLVISDVMMPEVDGLTMLKAIKSNKEWSGIPVVMLTALAAERDKLAALTIGVDDYLTKPFSVTELMARVQNLLYNYHQREEWQKSLEYLEGLPTEKADIDDPKISIHDQNWVKELEELIRTSFSTGIHSIEYLASYAHLSPRQFNRKIKASTGLSPARFIKEVQLQKARQELENGVVLSIKEVTYNNGFEHPATFSKIFKTRFGKSPSSYLKKVT